MKYLILVLTVLSQSVFADASLEQRCISSAKSYADRVGDTWFSAPRYAGILYDNCQIDVNGESQSGNSCSYRYQVSMQTWEVVMVEISGECVPY